MNVSSKNKKTPFIPALPAPGFRADERFSSISGFLLRHPPCKLFSNSAEK
jgi:hypothetical protein